MFLTVATALCVTPTPAITTGPTVRLAFSGLMSLSGSHFHVDFTSLHLHTGKPVQPSGTSKKEKLFIRSIRPISTLPCTWSFTSFITSLA